MPLAAGHPHLSLLLDALTREGAAQSAAHARLVALPLADRVRHGVSWPPMTVTDTRPARRAWDVELRLPGKGALHDGVSPGDLVNVGPVAGGLSRRGRVLDAGETGALVRIDGDEPLARWVHASHLVITKAYDPTTLQAYAAGLTRAAESDTPVVQALLEPPPHRPSDSAPTGWPTLDPSQAIAAHAATRGSPVALIHGPPGTGKTHTLGAMMVRWCAQGHRPWALADSNAATDHLARAAASRGLRVVRLGRYERVSDDVRPLTVRAQIEAGPHGAALRALDRDISRGLSRGDRGMGPLFRERRDLKQQAWRHIVESAQVLACTLGSLSRLIADLPKATVAVVDEATQALEPGIWVAAPHVDRLVLVGDPHQLGPVVIDQNNPLERSLLQRLIEEGVGAPMLRTQRRMHAHIQSLVQNVYGPTYDASPDVAGHLLADLAGVARTDLTTRPVCFVDTSGSDAGEERDPIGQSLFNMAEVRLVARAVGRLRAAGVAPESMGVITPYSAQRARLEAHEALAGVEVATVNGFQGREKDAILCSMVRSNPSGELGFVSDIRRLTVSVTRARRLLWMTGDSATLGGDQGFNALFANLTGGEVDPGAWQSIWDPAWSGEDD